MTTNYPKPPIVEAIIDIQVPLGTAVLTEAELKTFGELTEGKYPTTTPIRQVLFGIDTSNLAPTGAPQHANVGWRCSGSGAVVQLKNNGFTFSRLPPYTEWESFREEARAAWNQYRRLINPQSIVRYAVRFVNKINIDYSPIELFDYLKLYPQLPSDIPQDVGGMFMQLRMPQGDLMGNTSALINVALAPPDGLAKLAIVLDIDLFCEGEVAISTDEVWTLLDTFRDRKNKLFEGCITDKARELFK